MAQATTLAFHQLDPGIILAPERYDPRRSLNTTVGVPLYSIAELVSDLVLPNTALATPLILLDTSDARDGLIRGRIKHGSAAEFSSAKKSVQPGDVIISRLRPYLRQVAVVDRGVADVDGAAKQIVCSTEFFVLRSRDQSSIAFLAAFLLTPQVQDILAAAQEGGHHPRFNRHTLTSLIIPHEVMRRRFVVSDAIIQAAEYCRKSELLMRDSIREIDATNQMIDT